MSAQDIPDTDNETPSEFAARGTRIHKALELDSSFELSPDEQAAYASALKIKWDVVTQWQDDNGIVNYTEGEREARFWLNNPSDLSPMLSGQLDAHWLSEAKNANHILVIDFKSGYAKHVTAASKSWQLRCQALLAWKEYGERSQRIRVAFVKPEAWSELDYCDFTVFDLQQIEQAVNLHLWHTQQPDAPRSAGEHCKWCPARANCPEALAWSVAPIQSLKVVSQSNGGITKKGAAELVALAPVEAVREVFGKRTTIKYIMEAVRARLASLPLDEKYRLALKLQLGRKTDYIKDVQGAYFALITGGFPEESLWQCLSFDKAALMDLIQSMKNCRESEAVAFFENQLDEFIERGMGSEILAEA